MLGRFTRPLKNQQGFVLLATIAFSLILLAVGLNYFTGIELESQLLTSNLDGMKAFYGAETGAQFAMMGLSSGTYPWRFDWVESLVVPEGKVDVHYKYNGDKTGTITSTGYVEDEVRSVVLEIQIRFAWGGIEGAATLVGPAEGLGTFTVDGRNHDIVDYLNTVYPSSGANAIYTPAPTFNRQGNMTIGGTDQENGEDIAPTKVQAEWRRVAVFNAALPETPDKIMARNDGDMKQLAIAEGTYYKDVGTLNLVCEDNKVYYIELTSIPSIKLTVTMATPSSTAILIIHNEDPDQDAVLRLFEGVFKGLVVADSVDKIHGDIVGGLFTIGNNYQRLGNGNGGIYYSQAVVDNVMSTHSGDGAPLKIILLSWEEDNDARALTQL